MDVGEGVVNFAKFANVILQLTAYYRTCHIFLFLSIWKNENLPTVTASGRVVKKKFNLLDDDPEQEVLL